MALKPYTPLALPDQVTRVQRIVAALEQHQACYARRLKARETKRFYASRRWRT